MKTAKFYLSEFYLRSSKREVAEQLIKEIQSEAYNQAISDASLQLSLTNQCVDNLVELQYDILALKK